MAVNDPDGILGEYDISPGPMGEYVDPQDLPVFAGYFEPRETGNISPTGARADLTAPRIPLTKAPLARTKRQSELEKDFHRMAIDDPTSFKALQKRLYSGNFYPRGTDPEDVVLGDPDDLTLSAYTNAVDRAARFYAADQKLTLDEVIDRSAGVRDPRADDKGANRAPLTIELTDPETLSYIASKTAVSTLGRGFTPEELQRFVQSFHGAQSASQRAQYAAGATGGPGGTYTGGPAAEAEAAAFARQAAPTEAKAHDLVRVYEGFMDIIGRRRSG